MKINKTIPVSITFLFILLHASMAWAADLTCTRYLPQDSSGSQSMAIILQIQMPTEKPNGVIIKEVIPPGWQVIGASPGYDRFDGASGEIKWLLMGSLADEFKIEYQIFRPAGSKAGQEFSGKILYTDSNRNRYKVNITGDTSFDE